jgi:hypothetical protein
MHRQQPLASRTPARPHPEIGTAPLFVIERGLIVAYEANADGPLIELGNTVRVVGQSAVDAELLAPFNVGGRNESTPTGGVGLFTADIDICQIVEFVHAPLVNVPTKIQHADTRREAPNTIWSDGSFPRSPGALP